MADLTTTISESVTINGSVRGSSNTLTITGIEHTFERVVTIPADTDGTVLLTKDTITSSDGAVDIQDTKYIRITNLDSTNSVNISLQIDAGEDDSGADEQFQYTLEAGKSFMLGSIHDCMGINTSGGIITALHDLESILVDSSDQAVKLEVFVASV